MAVVSFTIVAANQEANLRGQISATAYRALGQPDLRQNGVNRVLGAELNSPSGIAIDLREGHQRLYVADTRNHRVLAWQDTLAFQAGEPATLVLGQPSPQHSGPLGIGVKGFVSPLGMAVDPLNGNLYVADFGNRDRKSTRLNSSHIQKSRMPSSA